MPDVSTEVAIATTTLGSAASSITFSSIPATYTDLRLVFTGTVNGDTAYMTFNSDTGTNYSRTYLDGDGSTATSGRATSASNMRLSGIMTSLTSTIPALITIDIFSYAGSTNKTVLQTLSVDKNGTGEVATQVHLWRNTAAITNVSLNAGVSTFTTGTTATLYGIL